MDHLLKISDLEIKFNFHFRRILIFSFHLLKKIFEVIGPLLDHIIIHFIFMVKWNLYLLFHVIQQFVIHFPFRSV